MESVGMDLKRWVDAGLLQLRFVRPSLLGLEAHLASMQDLVTEYSPDVVVMDPISDLLQSGGGAMVSEMLIRQVDFLKSRGVTALFTSLNTYGDEESAAVQQIGSLIDTWMVLKLAESDGSRHRIIYVLKSRGMAHSHEIRNFVLSDEGLLVDGVFHGTAVHP
jgi:circadian clock protein KaiC